MKLLFAGFAVAVLPLLGAHQGAALPPISLYTHFSEQVTPEVFGALKFEVENIMSPMGLTFRWLDLSAADGKEVAVELAVISFKGRCDVQGLAPHDLNPGPLGWTHMSGGLILPFSDVDCSAVRGFIQKELYFKPPESRERIYGRAIGRVLAHELYHIFANTVRHGANGVGREFYSAHDLLADDFQFEARESQTLMNSKAYAALANALAGAGEDAEHR
jgi:hypothetical protein